MSSRPDPSDPSDSSDRDDRDNRDEFYIGDEPPMPRRLSRFVTRVVIAGGVGAIALGGLAAIGHVPLAAGTFAFGQPRTLSGIVREQPYPALRLDGAAAGAPWALLVAPGKHGADLLVRGQDGRRVSLQGTPIERDGQTMFELVPGSLQATNDVGRDSDSSNSEAVRIGDVTLQGEIVDSKCFLGVMAPGGGKTHKDCASLCLRGGIPPALFVQDRAGRSALLLLEDRSGHAIGGRAIALAGEPVEITGTTWRQQGWLRLRSDPATWRSLAEPAPARQASASASSPAARR
jgi:hypothetical protein